MAFVQNFDPDHYGCFAIGPIFSFKDKEGVFVMNLKKVPLNLFKETKIAVENIYRFERIERFALQQVLTAAIKNEPIDEIFIKYATTALKQRPVNKSQRAA